MELKYLPPLILWPVNVRPFVSQWMENKLNSLVSRLAIFKSYQNIATGMTGTLDITEEDVSNFIRDLYECDKVDNLYERDMAVIEGILSQYTFLGGTMTERAKELLVSYVYNMVKYVLTNTFPRTKQEFLNKTETKRVSFKAEPGILSDNAPIQALYIDILGMILTFGDIESPVLDSLNVKTMTSLILSTEMIVFLFEKLGQLEKITREKSFRGIVTKTSVKKDLSSKGIKAQDKDIVTLIKILSIVAKKGPDKQTRYNIKFFYEKYKEL